MNRGFMCAAQHSDRLRFHRRPRSLSFEIYQSLPAGRKLRGVPTVEVFWERFIELCQPQALSFDNYVITVGTDAEIAAQLGQPNVFPQEKLIIKPNYFSSLELLRNLSNYHEIPFWAFTCSVRHGDYPTPTEGHIQFQLMNTLAYGAKGLQYFTYAHDNAMVRPDGSTTETWKLLARSTARSMLWLQCLPR